MAPMHHLPFTTSVLLIDSSDNQRIYWAEQLKRCSTDYEIVEASDGQSGLSLYRSRRFHCVVLELGLPDQTGFQLLTDLVPIPSKPQVPVIILTQLSHRGLWELAKEHGAYVCLHKHYTSAEDLDNQIQRAVAFCGELLQGRSGPA